MANVKISELTALTPPAAADELPVVDVSATSTKKTTVGEIVGIINGDVDVASSGTATISELPVSKLQDGATRQLLQTDAAGTGVEWTSNVDVPGTLDVTGATTLDSTLGVSGQSTLASAAVSDLTSGRVVLAGTSGEIQDSANLTFSGTQLDVGGDVVITGDLTVQGASTTLETQTVTVEDKNIELGVVATPTDATADGGGITLKGTTDKTINWVDATDAWTLSEHVDLASAKEYRIAGAKVLDATSLGSAVVSSSLTSVGTIGTGVWEGTAIDKTYLDATLVSTGDTGTVTSTMILDGTIVDADINASAAIAGTKIDPDFGSQTVKTTGILCAAGGSAAAPVISKVDDPDTGIYFPTANTIAFAEGGSEAARIDSNGRFAVGTAGAYSQVTLRADPSVRPQFSLGASDVNLADGYFVFHTKGSKNSTTFTCTITWGSQSAQYCNNIIEVIFSGVAAGNGSGNTTAGGRAMYTARTLTSVDEVNEIEDIGDNVSFAAVASGMTLAITATTTAAANMTKQAWTIRITTDAGRQFVTAARPVSVALS
jgi:uncharacterized Zn ribbon protein